MVVTQLSSLRRFGDMVTLHMGSQTWILLNSEHVASDILGKNGRVTGERPHMPVASGIVSEGLRNSLRSTAAWTEGRRVMHQLTSGSILRMYGDWHEVSSLKLLKSYLTEPKLWYTHHYRYSMDVLYRVSMGEELKKPKAELDAFQRLSMEFVWSLNRSIVDFFPLLDRLPYQPWRPYWEAMAKDHRSILEAWYRPVEISLERGIAGPSYIRDTLLHPDTKYSGSRDEAMYIVTSVMAAGSDNTRMVLIVFIMAMISYPSIQARARADIDAVCAPPGSALRLPGLDDMLKLPLISALVKEVIRWRPTVPLVPPHQLTEDLEYNGYTFPKGVCFVVNSVAVSRNIDPGDVFNPDRWLDGNEANILHGMNTFGGGRRICVGYRVAQQALWIAIARLLACFDFTAVSISFFSRPCLTFIN